MPSLPNISQEDFTLYILGSGTYRADYDLNNDGVLSVEDLVAYSNLVLEGVAPATDETTVLTGMEMMMQVSQMDVGISSGAVGSRKELAGMLESYKNKKTLIQSPQRQKAIYTIDRFDGGLNLNKSPRDLSYWEACQMDCLTPSKIGRLIRLGDFSAKISASSGDGLEGFVSNSTAVIENYGLHYFKWSDSIAADGSFAGETPTKYIAIQDGDDIDIWNLGNSVGDNDTTTPDLITSLNATAKPVYHDASNRVYVSDASFDSSYTRMFGIVDRRKLFPFTGGSSVSYCKTGNSVLFKDEYLYYPAPIKGSAAGRINVVGTQSASTALGGLALDSTSHHGIYMNINFEDITGDESSGTGWGGTAASGVKFYYIFASFLYDDGSETKLTPVSDSAANAGTDDGSTLLSSAHTIKATTTSAAVYQKMVIKQVFIDGTEMFTNFPRVHGVRFYYSEAGAADGDLLGNDKYLFAELDFRYGLKLVSEFGNWNLFMNDSSALAQVQIEGAAETSGNTAPDGTLSILSPPTVFTYYSLNLFHQEELKDDLLWATSTVGNGIVFIGNVKYDSRQYPDTMLYSGAGETDAGSAYPMWGTFPVDSNRIDIPGAAGEITALKWTSNRVLQFRKNALYVVNVEDVLAPRVEGVYQGMGVRGQYAVTETPFGVAWVNDNGAYAYNSEDKKARSLTIGRLDTEDFQSGLANLDKTKIGYDDRAKMLIITNTANVAADGYHYAYSFVTDAWCTWNANKAHASNVTTNFAIDHDGYLTGADDNGTTLNVYKWNAKAQTAQTIDYITKDIDFGKPSLDKRLYTLYISYTGGVSNAVNVYFRVNGVDGSNLTSSWTQIGSFEDFTNHHGGGGVALEASGVDDNTPSHTAWQISQTYNTEFTQTSSNGDGFGIGVTATTNGSGAATFTVTSTGYGYVNDEQITFTDQGSTSNTAVLIVDGGELVMGDDNISVHSPSSLASIHAPLTNGNSQRLMRVNLRSLSGSLPKDYLKFARSIQLRFTGTAATTFEINDISLVYKEKRLK